MICFTDHPTIVPNAQFPMPKAIIIESAVNGVLAVFVFLNQTVTRKLDYLQKAFFVWQSSPE